MNTHAEWIEADGLGGFASGTASGVRTRRYHALLLHAARPPAERRVLVSGFDAWIVRGGETVALSSQAYEPDAVHPDGAARIASFAHEPWPRWTWTLPGGACAVQELLVPRGAAAVVVAWRLLGGGGATLFVRPFLAGRDYHALHHENGVFRFAPEAREDTLVWRPYDGVPAIASRANATWRQEPLWYRRFRYDAERARGLDATEDLAAPGTYEFDLGAGEAVWLLAAEGHEGAIGCHGESPLAAATRLRDAERVRRASFATPLHRAADAYLVARGGGHTIVAGYPWFTDWGRDTFIAVRGLCIATGRLGDARAILLAWSEHVSQGMLPNRFPDAGETPEYNAVDASLWYVVAAHEWMQAVEHGGGRVAAADRKRIDAAVDAILEGYARGTRFGIRADADGLLAAGEPGVQLTWMDAKVGDWVVTPRSGKPVEVQALWCNALRIAGVRDERWRALAQQAQDSFEARFWDDARGHLLDVADADHVSGRNDGSFRPNQLLAIGGLPHALLEGERARRVVDAVEAKLWTPLGLRSLAPGEPGYAPHYAGGVRERDGAYHQGTVWPWWIGPFVEAWVRVRGGSEEAKREARERFVAPLLAHLGDAGLGHVSEVADGDAPHTPGGCPFQAWSLAELLRLEHRVLARSGGG